ncbi:GIY-YIG nuclease family protein [Streptomyces sp. NPDC001858]
MAADPTARTALYRAFSESDELLYVGISSEPYDRFRTHHREKDWWEEDVAKLTLEWFPDRPRAEKAEYEALHAELPLRNERRSYTSKFAGERPLAPVTDDMDVASARGVAEFLGVSPQRITTLSKRRDFPPRLDRPGPASWDLNAVKL